MSEFPVSLSIEGVTSPGQLKRMIAALHYHDRLVEALADLLPLAEKGRLWPNDAKVINAGKSLLAEMEEASR